MRADDFIQKGNPVVPIGMKVKVDDLKPGSYRFVMQAVDSAKNNAEPHGGFRHRRVAEHYWRLAKSAGKEKSPVCPGGLSGSKLFGMPRRHVWLNAFSLSRATELLVRRPPAGGASGTFSGTEPPLAALPQNPAAGGWDRTADPCPWTDRSSSYR